MKITVTGVTQKDIEELREICKTTFGCYRCNAGMAYICGETVKLLKKHPKNITDKEITKILKEIK